MKQILLLILLVISSVATSQTLTFPKELNLSTKEDLEPIGSNNDGVFYYDWEKNGRVVGINNEGKLISSLDGFYKQVNFPETPNAYSNWIVINNYIIITFIIDNKIYIEYIDTKDLKVSKSLSQYHVLNSSYKTDFKVWRPNFNSISLLKNNTSTTAYYTLSTVGSSWGDFFNLFEIGQEGTKEINLENNISELIDEDVSSLNDFNVTEDGKLAFIAYKKKSGFKEIVLGKVQKDRNVTLAYFDLNNNYQLFKKDIGIGIYNYASLEYDNNTNTYGIISYNWKKASKKEPIGEFKNGKLIKDISLITLDQNFNLIKNSDIPFDEIGFLAENIIWDSYPNFAFKNQQFCLFFKSDYDEKYVSTGTSGYTKYSHSGFYIVFFNENLNLDSYKKIECGANGKEYLEYSRFGTSFLIYDDNQIHLIANKNLRFFKDKFGGGEQSSELVDFKIDIEETSIEEVSLMQYSETGFITRFVKSNAFARTYRSFKGIDINSIPFTFIKRTKNKPQNLIDKKGSFYFGILDLNG